MPTSKKGFRYLHPKKVIGTYIQKRFQICTYIQKRKQRLKKKKNRMWTTAAIYSEISPKIINLEDNNMLLITYLPTGSIGNSNKYLPSSVTTFDKMLALWQKIQSYPIWRVYLVFEPTLATFYTICGISLLQVNDHIQVQPSGHTASQV